MDGSESTYKDGVDKDHHYTYTDWRHTCFTFQVTGNRGETIIKLKSTEMFYSITSSNNTLSMKSAYTYNHSTQYF